MKKIIALSLCLGILILTGCEKGEEVNCTINGAKAVFELQNGIVKNYTLDGTKIDKAKIDEINGEYFTSSTNNEEAKEALNRYVETENGTCQ